MEFEELSRKLEKRESFPTLSGVISEIVHEIDAEKISMEDLGKIIQKDVSFAAHLVRQANSGAYVEAGRVSSVAQAVRAMGFRVLKGLCMTLPVFGRHKDVPGVSELWYHSRVASLCGRILSEKLQIGEKDEAETVGLLHDLGKVFLTLEMPDFMAKQSQVSGTPGSKADWMSEREHIGIDHCFIGSRYGRMFHFPGVILDPILWHHEPEKANQNKELAHICCLGDQIAAIVGAPHPDYPFVEPALRKSLDYLGIKMSLFQSILEECLKRASSVSLCDFETQS